MVTSCRELQKKGHSSDRPRTPEATGGAGSRRQNRDPGIASSPSRADRKQPRDICCWRRGGKGSPSVATSHTAALHPDLDPEKSLSKEFPSALKGKDSVSVQFRAVGRRPDQISFFPEFPEPSSIRHSEKQTAGTAAESSLRSLFKGSTVSFLVKSDSDVPRE